MVMVKFFKCHNCKCSSVICLINFIWINAKFYTHKCKCSKTKPLSLVLERTKEYCNKKVRYIFQNLSYVDLFIYLQCWVYPSAIFKFIFIVCIACSRKTMPSRGGRTKQPWDAEPRQAYPHTKHSTTLKKHLWHYSYIASPWWSVL